MRGIYTITNSLNNKIYIGMTENFDVRWQQHLAYSRRKKKRMVIHRAIAKYGQDNFLFEILEECDSSTNLSEREIFWIERLKPEYNTANGGLGGDTFSCRTVDSKERTRAKNVEVSKNLWKDPVYRNMVSTNIRLAIGSKLQLWSECKQGKKNGRWLGYIEMSDPQGTFFMQFETAVECHKFTGITAQTIREHAEKGTAMRCGKYKKFTFKYVTQTLNSTNE